MEPVKGGPGGIEPMETGHRKQKHAKKKKSSEKAPDQVAKRKLSEPEETAEQSSSKKAKVSKQKLTPTGDDTDSLIKSFLTTSEISALRQTAKDFQKTTALNNEIANKILKKYGYDFDALPPEWQDKFRSEGRSITELHVIAIGESESIATSDIENFSEIFPNLLTLDLGFSTITQEEINLSKFKKLLTVVLPYNMNNEMLKYLTHQKLKIQNLAFTKRVGYEDIPTQQVTEFLDSCKNLETITFKQIYHYSKEIPDAFLDGITNSKQLSKIKSIDLSHCEKVTVEAVRRLVKTYSETQPKERLILHLNHTFIAGRHDLDLCEFLIESQKYPVTIMRDSLTLPLDLDDNQTALLKRLAPLHLNINRLMLFDNFESNELIQFLDSCTHLNSIHVLSQPWDSDKAAVDRLVAMFCKSKNIQNITRLELGHTEITDKAIKDIVNALKNSDKQIKLGLVSTNITEKSLQDLITMKTVPELELASWIGRDPRRDALAHEWERLVRERKSRESGMET